MTRELINMHKFGSYKKEDVLFLLKDLSQFHLEGNTEDREKQIQTGQHYSETLPMEYQPPQHYIELFLQALEEYKQKVAFATAVVSEQIFDKNGKETVLVSLARAGTPVGILIKRYLAQQYHVMIPHYSISIIRGKGIDVNALLYILHKHPNANIQFVDGWTGKGAISIELAQACKDFYQQHHILIDDTLAVVADPGFCTTLFGTREDFLIPSACLNSTVSGLISRTVLNKAVIGEKDFHGAKFYQELSNSDFSNTFIDVITSEFSKLNETEIQSQMDQNRRDKDATFNGMKEVILIKEAFSIESTHFIKPGVGETTRVLLRRLPWKILLKDLDNPYVRHIVMLAKEKDVELIHYPHMSYTCCGLIKKVGT